jgi:NAD(P)-dependent dehydrogenase (short-subunit alcohol dehydrogenase family)
VTGCCAGRVAIVTGAGRGIGRGHALELARQGAHVVVNDLGVTLDGKGGDSSTAEAVVHEIVDRGGVAVADAHDVSDFDGAEQLVQRAVDAFGGLDVVVNNAGVLRDRTLVNLDRADWEAVVRTHLGATFAVTRWAAVHWRAQSKAGADVDARVINTTSGAGLYGNPGQTNYSAAKAGVVGFTLTAAQELARYGVTVNAIGPGGRTRMTENAFPGAMGGDRSGWDPFDPENVAPVVAWLASTASKAVTGRVIEAWGGRLAVIDGWRPGRVVEQDRRWEPEEVGPVITELIAELPPPASMVPDTD